MKLLGPLAAGVLGATVLAPALPAGAEATVAARAAGHVRLTAPASAVEGERYALAVRVPAPRKVARATLQFKRTSDHAIDSVSRWTALRAIRVEGRARVSIPVRADGAREYAYRVRVTYRGAKRPVVSNTARVDYWHWVGLPVHYFSVGSGYDQHDYVPFTVAGRPATGWFLDRGASAEDRYTLPGRCRSLRATVGMADDSAARSTARLTLTTVDAAGTARPIWTSPTLTPGVTVPVSLALATPYRFSILGENTSRSSTDGGVTMTPEAQPALVDPELLCHLD